jgi:hypothetical protein
MCRVALGKPFYQFSAVKMAHSPPGHHSVIGRPSSGGLSFAEYVIYRGEQVNNNLVSSDRACTTRCCGLHCNARCECHASYVPLSVTCSIELLSCDVFPGPSAQKDL